MTVTDDARAHILLSGSEDWVSLAEAVHLVRTTLPDDADAPAVRRETLAVIAGLTGEGLVEVGELSPRFTAWDGSADDALRRIEKGWPDPEADLLPGDVCWLATTAAGDALAEELWQRKQEEG